MQSFCSLINHFKLILVTDSWGISCEIALRRLSPDLIEDKSPLGHVMAWCRQATSHCMSQCWSISMLPYGAIRPQCVNHHVSNPHNIISTIHVLEPAVTDKYLNHGAFPQGSPDHVQTSALTWSNSFKSQWTTRTGFPLASELAKKVFYDDTLSVGTTYTNHSNSIKILKQKNKTEPTAWLLSYCKYTLQWRHNGRDGISDHQPPECILNCLSSHRSKEIGKAPHHWPLCGDFTAQGRIQDLKLGVAQMDWKLWKTGVIFFFVRTG